MPPVPGPCDTAAKLSFMFLHGFARCGAEAGPSAPAETAARRWRGRFCEQRFSLRPVPAPGAAGNSRFPAGRALFAYTADDFLRIRAFTETRARSRRERVSNSGAGGLWIGQGIAVPIALP